MESQETGGDAGHDLDLVEVFRGVGPTGEMEAMGVQALLEGVGIESVIVGTSQLPMLPFAVMVPRGEEESARRAMAEAEPLA
jgi:hypothetical protein